MLVISALWLLFVLLLLLLLRLGLWLGPRLRSFFLSRLCLWLFLGPLFWLPHLLLTLLLHFLSLLLLSLPCIILLLLLHLLLALRIDPLPLFFLLLLGPLLLLLPFHFRLWVFIFTGIFRPRRWLSWAGCFRT
jgi:hypothetical protein